MRIGRPLLCSLLLLFAAGGIPAGGQEPQTEAAVAAPLPAAEATPFLGFWTAQIDLQGQQVDVGFEFSEHDGQLEAVVHSPLGEQPIDTILPLEEGLRLATQSSFGPLEIDVSVDGDELHGTFRAAAGQLSADFTGSRGDPSAEGERLRRIARQFGRRPTASLDAAGKRIRIEYADPDAPGAVHSQLVGLGDGEVLRFPEAPAIKLRTDLTLRFGETTIEAENAAPGYPGVYSLWLKRAGDSWHLVFNEAADVWGTQHFAELDVAEIPLAWTEQQEQAERLTVELVGEESGGRLQVDWGSDRWSARFEIEE